LSKKKLFSFGFGVLLGGRHKWGCFRIFMAYLQGPGRPSYGPTFWPKYFYETRLSHESLEPSIDFLHIWMKNYATKTKK